VNPLIKRLKGRGGERHGFTHVKRETLHLLQWKQMHLEPHHGNKEEGGALQHLKVGHRNNGSP
jgi:hypothetical protein